MLQTSNFNKDDEFARKSWARTTSSASNEIYIAVRRVNDINTRRVNDRFVMEISILAELWTETVELIGYGSINLYL
jgi:hypothetical protein